MKGTRFFFLEMIMFLKKKKCDSELTAAKGTDNENSK